MGLYGPRQRRAFFGITGASDLIPSRGTGSPRAAGGTFVTDERALRHSVWWACMRLRAGLISTFPVDQYRDVLGIQTEYGPKPPILTDPGGRRTDIVDWLAMSSVDLDRAGNTVGLIVERNSARTPYYPEGLPHRIELQPAAACAYIKRRDRPPVWRIDGKLYDPADVYHERANVVAGLEVGLPTVVYAASSLAEGLAMQEYGTDWFAGGGIPKAHMKNVAKQLKPEDIALTKQWYNDTINNGDLLVTGSDWEYDFIQSQTAGAEFIEGRKLTGADICRFLDTPADLVDVQSSSGGSITYANITQRLLEYLILRLGPAVVRRERALSKLLPQPRYVKLNTKALLRMDPETQQKVIRSQVESWLLTNTEARALDNRQPLTAAERTEMVTIYGMPKTSTGSATGKPADGSGGTDQSEDDSSTPVGAGEGQS